MRRTPKKEVWFVVEHLMDTLVVRGGGVQDAPVRGQAIDGDVTLCALPRLAAYRLIARSPDYHRSGPQSVLPPHCQGKYGYAMRSLPAT